VCQLQHHKAAVLPSDNLETTKQDPKTAPSVSGEQGVSGEHDDAEGDVLNGKPDASPIAVYRIAFQWIQTQAASYGRIVSGAFEPVSQHDFGFPRGIDWRRAGLA
jgi:hypothetical protein